MQISNDQNTITMPNGDIVEFVPNDPDNMENWQGCAACYFRHKHCRRIPCMGQERRDIMNGTFVHNDGSLQNVL